MKTKNRKKNKKKPTPVKVQRQQPIEEPEIEDQWEHWYKGENGYVRELPSRYMRFSIDSVSCVLLVTRIHEMELYNQVVIQLTPQDDLVNDEEIDSLDLARRYANMLAMGLFGGWEEEDNGHTEDTDDHRDEDDEDEDSEISLHPPDETE